MKVLASRQTVEPWLKTTLIKRPDHLAIGEILLLYYFMFINKHELIQQQKTNFLLLLISVSGSLGTVLPICSLDKKTTLPLRPLLPTTSIGGLCIKVRLRVLTSNPTVFSLNAQQRNIEPWTFRCHYF